MELKRKKSRPRSSQKNRPSLKRQNLFQPQFGREPRPLISVNRKQFKKSIRRDLSWLFNTRTPTPATLYDKKELTVIDYGIPDFGSYSPASKDDQSLLARRLTRAITSFEPRLKNVRIRVKPEMTNEKNLDVIIDAVMVVENVREPASFRTVFQKQTGEWKMRK